MSAAQLVEFLTARLDEAEVDARAADRNAARFDEIGISTTYSWAAHRSNSGLAFELGAPAPAFVLADIAAKRRIIALSAPVLPERTDAELHAAAAHPDWEYATTEGQRKAWDREDVPPDGEGWVRNVERGDNGWERFDYTEEAYWRRPRSEPARPYVPEILKLLALPFADHPDFDPAWKL